MHCFCSLLKSHTDSLQLFGQFTKCFILSTPFIIHIQNMTLLTDQARTERWLFYSLSVQAHFEQQEIILIHCSGACIFCGTKISGFITIGGQWRAYLSYRYDIYLLIFQSFFSYPLACILKEGSLNDSPIPSCSHNL